MPSFKRQAKDGSLADRYLLNRRGRMLLEQISSNLPGEDPERIAAYLAEDERNVYSTRSAQRISKERG